MKATTIAKLKEPQNRDDFNQKLDLIIEEFGLLAELKAKYEISPTIVRKLAKAKAEDKLDKLIQDNSEVVNLTAILE